MKISIKKLTIIGLLLFLFISLFCISNDLTNIIKDSCYIWFNNLIPSMVPFFILSDLLINYGFIDILALFFKKIIRKLFNVSGNSTFIIFFSLLTGFPSSAKYCQRLLDENLISVEETNKIICFTHFANPLFIINVVGNIILGSAKLGLIVLISHYIGNLAIGILWRNQKTEYQTQKSQTKVKPIASVLTESFLNSFNALLLVLGSIITFRLLTSIIYYYIPFNDIFKAIFNSILEITQGLFFIKDLDITLNIKTILASVIISFGGLCIHMQVKSILSSYKIKYKQYLISRIFHAIISGFITFILILL